MGEWVAAYQEQGLAVAAGLAETVFEIAWQLRSFDRLYEDIHQQDEKAILLLDQISDRRKPAWISSSLAMAWQCRNA